MVENQQDNKKMPAFRAVWPRTSPRLRRVMGLTTLFAMAAAGGGGAAIAATGLAPLWAVTGAALVTGVYTALLHAPRIFNTTENDVRSIGIPAPAPIRQIADSLLLKAGLAPKYKADVLILDQSLHPEYNSEGFNGTIFGDETDFNVFIMPHPAGRKRDRILIGIGIQTATQLNKAEITAVLAHELGHFINRPPHLKPLLTATRLFPLLLTGISILAAAPAAALAAIGMNAIIKLCSRSLYILDEERADRTAMGLYPAPRAMADALNKVTHNFKVVNNLTDAPEATGLAEKFNRAAEWVTQTHPTVAQRIAANEAYAAESIALHRAHNIPADPGAYVRRLQGRENPLRPPLQ